MAVGSGGGGGGIAGDAAVSPALPRAARVRCPSGPAEALHIGTCPNAEWGSGAHEALRPSRGCGGGAHKTLDGVTSRSWAMVGGVWLRRSLPVGGAVLDGPDWLRVPAPLHARARALNGTEQRSIVPRGSACKEARTRVAIACAAIRDQVSISALPSGGISAEVGCDGGGTDTGATGTGGGTGTGGTGGADADRTGAREGDDVCDVGDVGR